MKIAVIGVGRLGSALAASFVKAGHSVAVSSAHPDHAGTVAEGTGAVAATSNRTAVESAEVIVLAVPSTVLDEVLGELEDAADGRIVVDVTNRHHPDPGLGLDGSSNAEQLQARFPRVRVVKALNTAFASRQRDPTVDGVQLDGFVAGDDAEAKQAVLDLVGSIGFRPIDAGALNMARALEALAVLNVSLQVRNGWTWQTGWKLLGPTGP